MRGIGVVVAGCLLQLATASSARADGVARLLMVVGNNRPAEPNQPALHFADDDAIRTYERFEGLAEERILLARLDDTSRAYAALYPSIPAPTRAAVEHAAQELRARAAALRAQGRFVELLFVFAGHGGLHDGRPYLAIEDGRLSPSDLERLILAGDPADVVHVIIDACHAAGFVEQRGPLPGDREPLADDPLPFGRLVERYPHAGFVVAASASGAAFEWTRYGGGVASHLLRSALSGAADMAPPDGRVTYDEVDAFLRSATRGILPAEFRQEIRVIAPRALPSASIVDLPAGPRTTELLVDRPGRWYVRDGDGHRIVDLHHGRGTVRLVLPAYSARFELVEVRDRGPGCAGPGRRRGGDCAREELAHDVTAGGRQLASALPPVASTVATRGVIEDTVFEELLAEPYDGRSLDLRTEAPFSSAHGERPRVPALGLAYRGTIGRTVAGLGVMHGFEVRLELPIGGRLSLAPSVGGARGEATTEMGWYPVTEVDVGLAGLWLPLRTRLTLALGPELRWQGIDQAHPLVGDRLGSFLAAGLLAQAFYAVIKTFEVGVIVEGGGRAGFVDEDLRLAPWGAVAVGGRVGL